MAFVLLGVAGLLLRDRYAGPFATLVHAHGGNVAVSFAVYFLVARLRPGTRFARPIAAAAALAIVEAFEAFDGFGVMSNTYDPSDYAANAIGVALGWIVDAATGRRPAGEPRCPSS